MPTAWDSQQRQIEYERRLAEALGADNQMPQGQMVGGIYVAPNWTQQLAKALNPMLAKRRMDELDKRQQAIDTERMADRQTTLGAFAKALQGTPAGVETRQFDAGNNPDEQSGAGSGYVPAVPGDPNAAMSILANSRHPDLQQIATAQLLKGIEPEKPVVVGRSLMTPKGKVIGTDTTWTAEQAAAREAKAEQAAGADKTRRELAADADRTRRDIASQASEDRRFIAGMVNARQEQKNVPKLPAAALKMQNEELDAIGTSGAINADLGALITQIDEKKLDLSLVGNVASKAKNFLGMSDEQSRNFQSFLSTLEKLRNDSLRLNKGVQTEGDAQRAWNELVANINDPKAVKQRLQEIQKINARAANLRRMNLDVIRSNYGLEPLDTSGYQSQPAAVGGSGKSTVDDLLKKYGG